MTDYTKLNDRIVKQAFDAGNIILTEAQKQKLFQNKIRRAADMIELEKDYYYQKNNGMYWD